MPTTSKALPRQPAVARVLQQVTAMARRHSMFEPGTRTLVAVSGGADSLCLLHSMVRLRRLLSVEPVCFHFDHRLRPGSEQDAAYVREQARRLGVEFFLRVAESKPERGESVEAWARLARYEALFRVAEEAEATAAAVAHTSDDQAETVLLALVRGSGLEGLAGMEPVSPPVVRPLLETTREETQAFCRALRLRPRRDPMNADPAFLRVGIRTQVIPWLEERLGRNVRGTVARTAALLRDDARLIDALVGDAAEEIIVAEGRLDAGALVRTPRPVAARVVRRAILDLGVVPESAHIEAVLDLGSTRPGTSVSLPAGLIARREREYVRLLHPSPRGRSLRRGQTIRRSEREGSDGDAD